MAVALPQSRSSHKPEVRLDWPLGHNLPVPVLDLGIYDASSPFRVGPPTAAPINLAQSLLFFRSTIFLPRLAEQLPAACTSERNGSRRASLKMKVLPLSHFTNSRNQEGLMVSLSSIGTFYSLLNWGSERERHLPKVTQQI